MALPSATNAMRIVGGHNDVANRNTHSLSAWTMGLILLPIHCRDLESFNEEKRLAKICHGCSFHGWSCSYCPWAQ